LKDSLAVLPWPMRRKAESGDRQAASLEHGRAMAKPYTQHLYRYPKYYDVAFSFRNILQEVDFFEHAIEKFSRIPVKRVFELASGTSPYLEEWHRRGYEYAGLDLSREMLAYSRQKAQRNGIEARLYRANANRFWLGALRVDLAYVLLGSLFVSSNAEFFRHLDCVARILKNGGLYLLDGVVWFNILSDNAQDWTISRDGITVEASWRFEVTDKVAQTFRDHGIVQVHDHGKRIRLTASEVGKCFFPQEFLYLVQYHNRFEFIGWFEDFNLKKPATGKSRQIVILRKH